MKSKNPYKIDSNYCLRVPSLPFNSYHEFTKSSKIEDDDFKKLSSITTFIKALELASPALLSQFNNWINGSLKDPKKIERLHYSILKYFTRISTRATPFGLFAGCCVGTFGNKTLIDLKSIEDFKTFSRLDMGFFSQLINELSNQSDIRSSVNYYPNSSLYKISNQYRYTSYTYENDRKVYNLDGARHSKFLEGVLNMACCGLTIEQLALSISEEGIDKEEAVDYVNQLVDKQILVSELQLKITSSDNLNELIKRLKKLSIDSALIAELISLQNEIIQLDETSKVTYSKFYDFINKHFKSSKKINKYILQVDYFVEANTNRLIQANMKSIQNAMVILNKLSLYQKNPNLQEFKEAFVKRYQNKELPLTVVLDSEVGIGYYSKRDTHTPLLENLYFRPKKAYIQEMQWSVIDNMLLEKVLNTIQEGEYHFQINLDDIPVSKINWDDLPDSMSSIIEIFNEEHQEKLVVDGFGGSSASNLLARFSHGNKEIYKLVKKITDIEKTINNEKILAEIIHVPQARTGNILRRPQIRDYEIPFLGASDLSTEQQIHLNDIYVSVRNNKIVLRSKSLDKEILPRLTNAHNFSNGLPLYKFLCDLQYMDKRFSLRFNWNNLFEQFTFLPRVVHKNVVLSKAQWNIKTERLIEFFAVEDSTLIEQLSVWRQKHKIPTLVQLVDGDNLLLINMNNITCLKMFFNTIKNRKKFKLVEFLQYKANCVRRNSDYFCNEFLVSVYNQEKLYKTFVEE